MEPQHFVIWGWLVASMLFVWAYTMGVMAVTPTQKLLYDLDFKGIAARYEHERDESYRKVEDLEATVDVMAVKLKELQEVLEQMFAARNGTPQVVKNAFKE